VPDLRTATVNMGPAIAASIAADYFAHADVWQTLSQSSLASRIVGIAQTVIGQYANPPLEVQVSEDGGKTFETLTEQS
jgi:hypothetical protein